MQTTLLQLPKPYVWNCECGRPIHFWDPTLRAEDFAPDVTPLVALSPRLCLPCVLDLAALAGPEHHENAYARFNGYWMERTLVGLPDKAPHEPTVLATELKGEEGPLHVLGVGVDHWPLDFPHFVIDWGVPGCAPKIVILRLLVSIGWLRAPVWEMRWSWQQPQEGPTYQYIKGNGTPTPTPAQWDKLQTALRRLHEIANDARRPRGSTTLTREEFRERVEHERAAFETRHGRPPYDTDLSRLVGVSESTFKRYKSRGWLS